jgi:chromosome segregation ATPase
MAQPEAHIKRIEEKLHLLVERAAALRKEHEKLRRELEEKTTENEALTSTVQQLELQVDLLKTNLPEEAKMARAAIEKKINTYIREIDRCIALLGDES